MTLTVRVDSLRDLILARLDQVFPHHQSELMAGSLLFGELAGRTTHGIIRLLPGRFGPIDEVPSSDPVPVMTGPAAATIHGRPAALVATLATDTVAGLAREHGIGVVTTRGSRSSSGSLAYYVEKLTQEGLVGLMAASTGAFVAPEGGLARMLGTNPLCIGLPTRGLPFLLDMGTSAVTFGDVAVARQQGRALPEGVAVDEAGEPTTDPDRAVHGALLAFGGHRGLGLAMAIELMAGGLSGAMAAGGDPERGWGHVLVAISLATLGDADRIRADLDDAIDRMRSTPTRHGSPVRIPGEASLRRRDQALARGTVDVDEEVYRRVVESVEA